MINLFRPASVLLAFFILVLFSPGSSLAEEPGDIAGVQREPRVNIYPRSAGSPAVSQGGIVVIEVCDPSRVVERVLAETMGMSVPFHPNSKMTRWLGLAGVDMKQEPGTYPVSVSIMLTTGKTVNKTEEFVVLPREYGVQELTFPPGKPLTEAQLAKLREDNKKFASLWHREPSPRFFRGEFTRSVPGIITSEFGLRRIINGEEKSPHSGVDYRAGMGEPVLAIEAGQVALVINSLLTGNAVVIDHGAGLYSMYFHLSQFKVQEGDIVSRGQVIGLAGKTGRATAPHLHLGVRLLGAKVDPEALYALTPLLKELEE